MTIKEMHAKLLPIYTSLRISFCRLNSSPYGRERQWYVLNGSGALGKGRTRKAAYQDALENCKYYVK